MMTTAELRWFYSGTPPAAIAHWFGFGAPESREDLYLYTPGCDYLNIKLRQGGLEIKWRQAELGIVRFGDRLEGLAEKWSKCICEDLQAILPADAVETGTWVSVGKERSQRHYQILPGESLTPVQVKEPNNKGCSVELTKLRIRGKDWWSLALEAFGEDANMMDNLQATGSLFAPLSQELTLRSPDSYAYSKWLSMVVQSADG